MALQVMMAARVAVVKVYNENDANTLLDSRCSTTVTERVFREG